MPRAYYNEIDDKAAAWLRSLIEYGAIADGDVDTRSIEDVTPNDLKSYTQCHFFAGIGGWSYALRLAGWPDDRCVWTGSCPCQPFSTAGKGNGFADERHLWPAFFYLIEKRRPDVIFGEQVASPDGLAWLDLVLTDLEGAGHTAGAFDLCAAGIGAPHLRQRLYWMAYAKRFDKASFNQFRAEEHNVEPRSDISWLGNTTSPRLEGLAHQSSNSQQKCTALERTGGWSDCDWLPCRDGKLRPVESGTFPLADGIPCRVGFLRGYGNAIVPQAAAEVIKVFMSLDPLPAPATLLHPGSAGDQA